MATLSSSIKSASCAVQSVNTVEGSASCPICPELSEVIAASFSLHRSSEGVRIVWRRQRNYGLQMI